jgi:hypothetical protein
MKKIYICVIALSVGSLSFGQSLTTKTFSEQKQQRTVAVGIQSSNTTPHYKAPGDVLWSENFDASSSLPTGWTSVDNTGNDALWIVQAAGVLPDADYTTAQPTIASTSGQNCMSYYSDGYQSPIPAGGYYDVDAYFQSAAIPLANVPDVSVKFQQSFRKCCSVNGAVAVLSVSKDAAFTNPTEYDIINGVSDASVDPMDVSVNISAVAANYTGDIYIRFHIQEGIEAYYWMIDDIQVVETELNDMVTSAATSNFFGVEYSRIPASQIQPMNASMIYNNIGATDQNNSNLTVTIDDGTTPVELSTPNVTIGYLERDTIVWDSLWTPSTTVGTSYTVTVDILSEDSTDATPTNNTRTMPPFVITDGIMALDDYSATPRSTGGGNGGGVTEYEAGNQFDCTAAAPLYAIEIVTGDGTPVNTYIDAVLYLFSVVDDAAVYTEVWRSQSYATTAADINTPKKFYDVAGTPIFSLVAGETYIAAVHSFVDFEYGVSGTGPLPGTPTASHSFISYPNIANPNASSTFNLSSTPMIRLDLKMTTVGIEEGKATANFSVYPNPSNGQFTINLNNNMKTAVISVKNVVGQTILNKTVNVAGRTTETISLADYSKGVYFLTVNDETVKLIIE